MERGRGDTLCDKNFKKALEISVETYCDFGKHAILNMTTKPSEEFAGHGNSTSFITKRRALITRGEAFRIRTSPSFGKRGGGQLAGRSNDVKKGGVKTESGFLLAGKSVV